MKKIEINEKDKYYLVSITSLSTIIIITGIFCLFIYDMISILLIIYGIIGIIFEIYVCIFVKRNIGGHYKI